MGPTIKLEQIASQNQIYKLYSLDYYLSAVERIGYKSVAFWAGPPHYFMDGSSCGDIKNLKRKFAQHGLACTCWTTPALLPPNQFAIEGKEHIEDTYNYFCNGVRMCAEMGAHLMVHNSGFGMRTHDPEEAWKRCCDLTHRVAAFAEKYDVTLTCESMRPPETNLVNTLASARRMIDAVNHPNLKAMIDTTAMSVSGETVWQWFEEFGDDLVNLHFVDCTPFGHLAWGDGNSKLVDMLNCLNQYHYEGPIGLEVTGGRYELNPVAAEAQCFKNLVRFVN